MWARFEASALFEFLRRVDGELSAPAEIVLVGGSAIATIDPTHTTSDVDLLSPGSRVFDDAVTRLRARGVVARLSGSEAAENLQELADQADRPPRW